MEYVPEGKKWAGLLKEQPELADQCPWDKFQGYDWFELLKELPEFADRCPWDKLRGWAI